MAEKRATWNGLCAVRRVNVIALASAAMSIWVAARAIAQTMPDTCAPKRTALVLSGGGARGFAHVGVFHVLDSLRIRPDLIVGTSAGAIAGALYSSGYTAREIDSLIRALPIREIIQLYEPRPPGVLAQLPALAVWENHGRGFQLQTGAVREGVLNAHLNALMLRGNLAARGDFDRLPIPLRVVAADLETRRSVPIGSGDLAKAVRASAAVPLLFAPVEVDGRLLVDGGVTDNTPVAVARAMGAERIIVSLLARPRVDFTRLDDPVQAAMALRSLLFVDDTVALESDDIRIVSPTEDVAWLDFFTGVIDSLIASGAATARRALEGRCVRTMAATRAVRELPPLRFGAVVITGENPIERAALRTTLGIRSGSPVAYDTLRARLIALGRSDALRAVWLTPTGTDSTVNLDVRLERTGRQVMTVGLAYDNDMGGRIWGGFADRRLFGWSLEGALWADVGKYHRALRATLLQHVALTGRAFPLYGALTVLDEDVRLFRDSVEFDPITIEEFIATGGVWSRLGEQWSVDVGAEVRTWSEPGRRNGPASVGVHVRATRTGLSRHAFIVIDGIANTDYHRAAFDLLAPVTLGRFELAHRLRVGWGERLPSHQTFAFGGTDGFAGFIIGERRGSHELTASLAISRPVLGPVYARGEAMVGAVGAGTRFLAKPRGDSTPYLGQRVTGIRFGVEVRAPALDIRFEHGINNVGRSQSFVRIGRWY